VIVNKTSSTATKRINNVNNSNTSLNESEQQQQFQHQQPTVSLVSSKPPLDKRMNKIQSQKPIMQGWLFKKKQNVSSSSPSSNSSSSYISSSSMTASVNSNCSNNTNNSSISYNNNNNKMNNLIKNRLNSRSKWKKYWCVLMKDYLIFYKNPDEKVPKDFLMLKDFDINKEHHKSEQTSLNANQKQYAFYLVDNSKQLTHEFYVEQIDELNEWYQALLDVKIKLTNEQITASLSMNSLSSSSGYETMSGLSCSLNNNNNNSIITNQNNRDDLLSSSLNSSCLTYSQPSSTSTNRKNFNNNMNNNYQLSTIIDSNDDNLNNINNNNNNNNTMFQNSSQQKNITNFLPSLAGNSQQQYLNNSSRESSPDISNYNSKLASRDSSPGLNYRIIILKILFMTVFQIIFIQ
jgi:hypothetical protein